MGHIKWYLSVRPDGLQAVVLGRWWLLVMMIEEESLVATHGALLVYRHKICRKFCWIKIWMWPCEEHKERMRQGTDKAVVLIMDYGIWPF